MTSPLVSVIIPSYNAENYIQETLQSVCNQTITDIEIIVVDDGSTDNQKQKIAALANVDSRIQYMYQNNQGVSVARNFGYQKSKGKYIAFLDADDVWLRNNLEKKINKFNSDNFGLVHSDVLVINSKSELTGSSFKGKEGYLLDGLLAWREMQIPGPSSILILRNVIESVGLFDPHLSTAADMDFFIRVAAEHKIGRVAEPTWHYRIHEKNMHKQIDIMEKDILYLYKKAKDQNRFKDKAFERSCMGNMFVTLSANWIGDGKNLSRGLYFLLKAIQKDVTLIIKIPLKYLRRWIENNE